MRTAFQSKVLHLMNTFQSCSQNLQTQKIMFLGHTLEDYYACLCQRYLVQLKAFPSLIWNLLDGIRVHLELILSTP